MFETNYRLSVTIKDFQENLPVGRNADVFLIDMIIQKHCAWVLPRLFSEANPEPTHTHKLYMLNGKGYRLLCLSVINILFDDECYALGFRIYIHSCVILPVNAEVKLALLFQLRKQLLFGLSDSHALGKNSVHKELAGLTKQTGTHDWTIIFLITIATPSRHFGNFNRNQ